MEKKDGARTGVKERIFQSTVLSILLFSGSHFVGLCVALGEEDNSEKALNFEDLLVQAKERTAELDSETKRIKSELAEFAARNRELSAQLESARQKMAQLGKEAETVTALLERKAMDDATHP
ncbi:MAG TPA: hypothetical protein VJU54_01890 [Nitrospiraceae bacterium]|nr:hypothetical protein [Nitrospiraceae bacterium]